MIAYQWNGDAWEPLRRFKAQCVREHVVGEIKVLEVKEDRSSASHAHFFAALDDAYTSLPDGTAERFASVEHFRKYLLIKAGWRSTTEHVCASDAEALRTRKLAKQMDDYAVVDASGPVVTIYTARSISYRGMDRKAFQAVKDRVLTLIADILGATPADVRMHAGAEHG